MENYPKDLTRYSKQTNANGDNENKTENCFSLQDDKKIDMTDKKNNNDYFDNLSWWLIWLFLMIIWQSLMTILTIPDSILRIPNDWFDNPW